MREPAHHHKHTTAAGLLQKWADVPRRPTQVPHCLKQEELDERAALHRRYMQSQARRAAITSAGRAAMSGIQRAFSAFVTFLTRQMGAGSLTGGPRDTEQAAAPAVASTSSAPANDVIDLCSDSDDELPQGGRSAHTSAAPFSQVRAAPVVCGAATSPFHYCTAQIWMQPTPSCL